MAGNKQYVIIDQSGPGDAWAGCYDNLTDARAEVEKQEAKLVPYLFIIEVEKWENLKRLDGPAWCFDGTWKQQTQKKLW